VREEENAEVQEKRCCWALMEQHWKGRKKNCKNNKSIRCLTGISILNKLRRVFLPE
jgi:hypothetical protein